MVGNSANTDPQDLRMSFAPSANNNQPAEVGIFMPEAEVSSNRVINELAARLTRGTPNINLVIFRTEQKKDKRVDNTPLLKKKEFLHNTLLTDIVFPFLEQNEDQNPSGIYLPPSLLTKKYPGRIRVVDVKDPNDPKFIKEHIEGNPNLKMSFSVKNLVIFKKPIIEAHLNKDPQRASFINIHPAKLPNIRGLEGPFWSRVKGETEYCTTMHVIDTNIDTGPILDYETKSVNGDAGKAVSTYPRDAAPNVADMIYKQIHLKLVRHGSKNLQIQDDQQSSYCTVPTTEDLENAKQHGIKFTDGSEQIRYIMEHYTNRHVNEVHANLLNDKLADAYYNHFKNNHYQKPKVEELKIANENPFWDNNEHNLFGT